MNPPDDKDRDTRDDITRLARDGPLRRPADPDATIPLRGSGDSDATVRLAGEGEPTVRLAGDPTVAAPISFAPPKAARPEAPSVALPVGYRLHEYRVDSVLGQGGFGITYLAADVNLDATKTYLLNSGVMGDFTFRSTGFRNHNDAWSLRPSPAREAARNWLKKVAEK